MVLPVAIKTNFPNGCSLNALEPKVMLFFWETIWIPASEANQMSWIV